MNGDDEFGAIRSRPNLYKQGGIQAIEPFAAGDVLTDSDFNELLDALKELDLRLRALEQK